MIEERELSGRTWLWPKGDVAAYEWLQQEAYLPEKILSYVTNFDTCIHAGAHVGTYAQTYAKRFERVYAIEPDPTNFFCLVNNVLDRNVIKIQAALSSRFGLCGLSENGFNSGGIWMVEGESTLCIQGRFPGNVGLIHLDVEGAELLALKGCNLEHRPIICVETMGHSPDVGPFLKDYGYEILETLEHDTIFGVPR